MSHHDPEERFRAAWQAVRIHRRAPYSLFTFGESELEYYLVEDSAERGMPVEVSRGQVRVTRPMIITPQNATPQLLNFFEEMEDDEDFASMAGFLLARSAAFSHLQLDNRPGQKQLISDSVDEIVSRLDHKLEVEDEDRIAILTAPHGLGNMAVLRYTAERIVDSAPENIQELREKGFLPGDE